MVGEVSVETQKTESIKQAETVIEDLDAEIFEAIGERVAQEREMAPAIPKSIAVRIEDILKKGLPKEEREKLLKTHVPPSNCSLIDPPMLNDEIKASISEPILKRDDQIVEKQKKITACLSSLGSAIADIINNNTSVAELKKLPPLQMSLIKKLSEASRLLTDLQRDESLTRRSLILASISASQKETLKSASTDEWLFGQNLGDRLKAAVERAGKDLKSKPKTSGKAKNFKDPPRRQSFRTTTSGGYRNKPYSQYQSNKKNWSNHNKEARTNQKPQSANQQKKE